METKPWHVHVVDDTDNYATNLGISKERSEELVNEAEKSFQKWANIEGTISDLLYSLSRLSKNANENAYIIFKTSRILQMVQSNPMNILNNILKDITNAH